PCRVRDPGQKAGRDVPQELRDVGGTDGRARTEGGTRDAIGAPSHRPAAPPLGMGNREWGMVGMGNRPPYSPFPPFPIPDCPFPRAGRGGGGKAGSQGGGRAAPRFSFTML